MQLELPKLITKLLTEERISRRQFVERMSYRNVNKGMRYLTAWLRGEELPGDDHVVRLAKALGRKREEIEDVVRRDTSSVIDEARRRRAEDRRYYLITRYIPGFYATEVLGVDLGELSALDQASSRAAEIQRRCCLNTPSNRSYWLGAKGEIECV
ncbi:MAG: hypothetical protein JRH20_28610, partial [Deltaproteobacteria bacterium]|nr:hypothetical protein [Deltaproteobacteria bacterium]